MPNENPNHLIRHTPIFVSKNGNKGFIALDDFICIGRTSARAIARKYNQRLTQFFGITWEGDLLKLLPEDQAKYPLFQFDEGGTILPFAAIAGPLYDKEAKGKHENTNQS